MIRLTFFGYRLEARLVPSLESRLNGDMSAHELNMRTLTSRDEEPVAYSCFLYPATISCQQQRMHTYANQFFPFSALPDKLQFACLNNYRSRSERMILL